MTHYICARQTIWHYSMKGVRRPPELDSCCCCYSRCCHCCRWSLLLMLCVLRCLRPCPKRLPAQVRISAAKSQASRRLQRWQSRAATDGGAAAAVAGRGGCLRHSYRMLRNCYLRLQSALPRFSVAAGNAQQLMTTTTRQLQERGEAEEEAISFPHTRLHQCHAGRVDCARIPVHRRRRSPRNRVHRPVAALLSLEDDARAAQQWNKSSVSYRKNES